MELRKSQPQKGTPARRRAKRPVNSPARKTYASENDMPSEASLPIELPGPFTPRKSASNSPAPSSQTAHPKPKPRNGNNTRVKQASSPRPPKHGQTTPPQTAAVPKAIPVSAFAGATFHASPAPSSLPIPSFLSKGPGSPSARKDTDRICGEPSPPATDSEAPTPQHRLLKAEPTLQESPLDIFFRADRAEKERARRASSANILRPHPVPFSPPAQIRSPQEPKTVPRELFSSGNRRHGLQRKSSTGIPVSELDGTPGTAVGPAFSKPYQDRIRAARSTEKRGEPMKKSESYDQNPATVDASERLKRLLAIRSVSNGQQPLQVAAVSRGLADLSPPFGTGSQPASASSASHVSGPESPEYSRSFVCPPPPEARYNYTETPPSSGISQAGNVVAQPTSVSPILDAILSSERCVEHDDILTVTPAPAKGPAPHSSRLPPSLAISTCDSLSSATVLGSTAQRSVITEPVVSRAPEIVHMEDNLRRLLKLNIGSNPALPTSYQSS